MFLIVKVLVANFSKEMGSPTNVKIWRNIVDNSNVLAALVAVSAAANNSASLSPLPRHLTFVVGLHLVKSTSRRASVYDGTSQQ